MTPLPTLVDSNLPMDTLMRLAHQRGGILQTNGKRDLIHSRILPGFTRVHGGGEVHRVIAPEAA